MTDVIQFEGHALTTIAYKGQPALIAREVGAVLGYASDGGRLVKKITGEWAGEFIDGRDFVKLEGDDLADLKALVGELGPDSGLSRDELPTESVGSRARSLVLLTESGVDLVCLLTRKEVGKRLRRFLVDNVTWKMRRGIPVEPARHAPAAAIAETPAMLRERRLMLREQRLLAAQRANAFRRLAAEHDALAPDVKRMLMVKATQEETGADLSTLLPVVEDGWLTPSQIADRLGVTANRVGRAISALNLRGNIDGMARAKLDKAPGIDKSVTTYEYSPRAVETIREHLATSGHLPTSPTPPALPPPTGEPASA